MQFSDLGLIEQLLRAVKETGYTAPTPIQQQAIPVVLSGKDLFGGAQTGTGKTASFVLPILQRMFTNNQLGKKHIHALILTPTRELAIQIDESIAVYGKYLGVKHTVIFGGVKQAKQVSALQKGVDILVATPGRLLDLINQRHVDLSKLSFFVLDEADRMLDMGFIHDVKRILKSIPEQRQSLFFSATMPPAILKLAHTILKDPEHKEVTPVSTTVDTVRQSVYMVPKSEKNSLLIHLLQDPVMKTTLAFTRTKHGANKLTTVLTKAGIAAAAIHGNKSQNARQLALSGLKDGTIRVLVATDVAARGIDIDLLSHVINVDIPNEPETYVHRIGRTGRAGATGEAISFCEPAEKKYWSSILKLINRQIPQIDLPTGMPQAPSASVVRGPRPERKATKPKQKSSSSGEASKESRSEGSYNNNNKNKSKKKNNRYKFRR